MIFFLADDHYGARPGAVLNEILQQQFSIEFFENDVHAFTRADFSACDLLILNLISGTGDARLADQQVEESILSHVTSAKPMLLLHGGNAAFWQWPWWRGTVGFRWVRGDDPDGFAPSVHPTRPYKVSVSKCRHPLCAKLRAMDLPADEIYIDLEQTAPAITLLETTTEEGTFPQCWETITPWGGKIVGFLPGHSPDVVRHSDAVSNVVTLIDYLTASKVRGSIRSI